MLAKRFPIPMQVYFPGGMHWAKKPIIIRSPPRWAFGHPELLSTAQKRATLALAELGREMEGVSDIYKRITMVRERLSGKSYGGISKAERAKLRHAKREAYITKVARELGVTA